MARPRESNRHLPKYVTVIHGSYWYRPPNTDAVRIARVGDEAELYKFMARKAEPAGPIQTMNDLFDRYDREVIPQLEPRTQKDYRQHLGVLRKTFGHMGKNDIVPRDIGRFLSGPTRGAVMRNRQIATLSAVCTKAVGRWFEMDRNPCAHVERNPTKPRDRNVSDAEFAAVRALANPRLQVAMDLALLTGQRQGDLLRMRWSQVTTEGIVLQQGKTGKRLLIGMSPALEEVLNRARAFLPHLPREYVLRRRDGKPYTENGFRAIWQRTMRRYKAKGGQRFTFHDIRGKSATDSETLNDAYERLGHTSIAMTRRVYDRGVRKVRPLK